MGRTYLRFFRLHVLVAVLFGISAGTANLAAQTGDVTLLLRRTYTTSAKVFPDPSSPSSFIRNQYILLEGLTGFSGEVRVPVGRSDLSVALSVEYLSHVDEGMRTFSFGGARSLPFRDGYALIPIEIRGIANIPLQSDVFRLTMAGGGGIYLADRILEVAGVGVRAASTTAGYGIHVSVSLEYRVLPGLWVHGETRFRDPDVTLEYSYERSSVEYNGQTVPLPTAPMQSRLNVDGMSLAIGVMVELPAVFHQ